jgi:hypothetical protein
MINDDLFLLQPAPEAPIRRSKTEFESALRGIGGGYFESFGERTASAFGVGDVVEYYTPDKLHVIGELHRKINDQWVVKIDDGAYQTVPTSMLQHSTSSPKHVARAKLKTLFDREGANTWTLSSGPDWLDPKTFRVTVDYGQHNAIPSDDALNAYLLTKFGAKMYDAGHVRPGVLQIVANAVDSRPEHAEPGTERPELDGTGVVRQAFEDLCAANPTLSLAPHEITEDLNSTVLAFSVKDSNTRGTIAWNGEDEATISVLAKSGPVIVQGRDLAPYGDGNGPISIHENEPNVQNSGNYIVNAQSRPGEGYYTREQWEEEKKKYQEHEETAPKPPQKKEAPPQEWMTAAVDPVAKQYWCEYFGEDYCQHLIDDVTKHNAELVRTITASWLLNQDRDPTNEETLGVLAAQAKLGMSARDAKQLAKQLSRTPERLQNLAWVFVAQRQAEVMPPAAGDAHALHMHVQRRVSDGGYFLMDVMWDPEAADGLGLPSIKQRVISFIKGLESQKAYIDYGVLGRVVVEEIDAELGLAKVRVRSSEARAAPKQVVNETDQQDT